MQFDAFLCNRSIFSSDFVFKKLPKITIFYILVKSNYFSYSLVIGYLATGNVFENMLQLVRFSVNFKISLMTKLLFEYRNNEIIAACMLG